jgi:hypothetical protein
MCLLNSLRPLLLRCVRMAALPAAADDDSGLDEPRKNFRKSGATLSLYKKSGFESILRWVAKKNQEPQLLMVLRANSQIFGSNFASTSERCTLTPPPEELEPE